MGRKTLMRSPSLSSAIDVGAAETLVEAARWVVAYLLMSVIAFGLAGLLRSSIATLGLLIAVPVVVGTEPRRDVGP